MQSIENLAILIADLGYGDAGKGSLVDYLTRTTNARTIIRYNGGAQAAHNVITPSGQHHTFAQFGSGMFLPGVQTHLSRFMLLHPPAMLEEEQHLRSLGVQDAFSRTTLEREALVITPFQQAANRLKEMARGAVRHGSCGMGVGETMADWLAFGADVLFASDLENRSMLEKKLRFLRDAKLSQVENLRAVLPARGPAAQEWKLLLDPDVLEATADVYAYLASQVRLVGRDYLRGVLNSSGVKIFEGAQGVLLDEWWGFYPYNSWSTLTYTNASELLAESSFAGQTLRLGLIRGYATRHGTGPFVTEDQDLTQHLQDVHNVENAWQRQFRVGYLDLLALRYALQVCGPVDGLVITNLDRLQAIPEWKICTGYHYPGLEPSLTDFFDCRGRDVSVIRVPPDPTDLEKQEQITRLLMQMQPVYTSYPSDLPAYLAAISQGLGLPVVVTSHGPTAKDKFQHLPWKGQQTSLAAQIPNLDKNSMLRIIQ